MKYLGVCARCKKMGPLETDGICADCRAEMSGGKNLILWALTWFLFAAAFFLFVFGALPKASGADPLPLKLLPDQLDTVTDLKITVMKPARWPLNPFARHAMKKRGETPQPRPGLTREIRLEGRTKIK